jgi:hypothetical protein
MIQHRDSTRAALRRTITGLAIFGGVVTSVACERTAPSVAPPPPSVADTVPTPAPAPTPAPSLVPADSALQYPFVPNPARTPGATLDVTAADICVSGYSKRVRNVPAAVKREAYASYGIPSHQPGEYEVDHLISLELGGSNSLKNLWPQSFRTHPWNAYVKDALENELHRRVCAGTIDLATAQHVIAHNWVIGYRVYVHQNPPSSSARKNQRRRQRREYSPPHAQFDSPVP